MKSILFICEGNTCRSPMAESLLRHHLKQKKIYKNYKVDSAGISSKVNTLINNKTTAILKQNNILAVKHRPRKFTKSMIKKYDIILTMTKAQQLNIGNYNNVHSISSYLNCIDVPDPYGKDYLEYNKTFGLLEFMINELVNKLIKENN